jgi:predicted dienelactone hydrolase
MDDSFTDASQGGKTINVRIYYPGDDPGGSGAPVAAGGPFPVIVWGHETVLTFISFSHDGYSYLAEHLATWGVIVICPDLGGNNNAANDALDLVGCLDHIEAENTGLVSPFRGKVNIAELAAGGHGRGGEAAIRARAMDGRVKAIAAAAPSNPSLPIDIPSITLGAEEDIFCPFSDQDSIYQLASRPKLLLEVLGGDHSQFHDDAFTIPDPAPGAPQISRGVQHDITRTYITAFAACYLRNQGGYANYLFGPDTEDDGRIVYRGAR